MKLVNKIIKRILSVDLEEISKLKTQIEEQRLVIGKLEDDKSNVDIQVDLIKKELSVQKNDKAEANRQLNLVKKELNNQMKEFGNKTNHNDGNLLKHLPESETYTISEVYNIASNTQRIIYVQKLDSINRIINIDNGI